MTTEEAIKGLRKLSKEFSGYKPNEQMFEMAINALETQDCQAIITGSYLLEANVPSIDTISRQAAIDVLDRNHILGQGLLNDTLDHIADAIMALSSAQPDSKELSFTHKALDTISRQDAIRIVDGIDTWQAGWRGDAIESMKALPSAQPEVTEESVKEYCRKRCLCIVDSALLKKYASAQPEITVDGYADGFADGYKLGKKYAQPQRTGRWIDHVEDGYVECPFCHAATNCDDNISDLHFCFSCGERMEGE